VVVVVLLAGCSPTPDHAPPAMAVPDARTSPGRGTTDPVRSNEWRRFFLAPAPKAAIVALFNHNATPKAWLRSNAILLTAD
jgi:hypothetical protein